jgi:NADP-dependent 3-hydroxy acid dehydrogenase YdfG
MLESNQLAMVTGASSGIGRAIAIALAQQGLRVIFIGRDPARLRDASEKAGPNASFLAADLTTKAGRAAAAARTVPALDVLVHSAGAYLSSPTHLMTAERWRSLDSINLHAPILLTTACLRQLRAATGQVVFINSSAAVSAAAGLAAYAASKRGLQAAADVLRRELNQDGIRVLSLFPGRTDTPMQRAVLASERREAPPNVLMRAEDVADVVVAALRFPRTAEITDIFMRPMRKL